MPSRGKRVAARQNNLRRRRNNTNRSNPPAGARATAVAEPDTAQAQAPVQDSPAASPAPSAVPAGTSRPIGRSETQPRGRRFDRPAAYNHVGSELKRIGLFSGVLVVVLVAVSFVL